MKTPREKFLRRAQRVRTSLRKLAEGKPRLSVARSLKNISVQLIDDEKGVTIAAASTLEKPFQERGTSTKSVEAAAEVGRLIAERALQAGIDTVVFDRGGFIYHGRVKALAEAAREGGLKF
jgi:large subunit ribosomal protein L18